MRVAVTGATGFLGSHLVEVLRERFDVRGLVRSPEKGAHLGIELVRADLTDVAALTEGMRGCDALVANAALAPGWAKPSAEEFVRANVEGAENQLRAAVDAGVKRIVWISTVAVYRTRPWRTLAEDAEKIDPAHPRFDWNNLTTDPGYARSKAAAERLAWDWAREHGLELTALRPGPIYGERDPKLTARYQRMLSWPVVLAPTAQLPHVHAGDVALAAAAALENPASVGRAYNVTGESISVWRLLSIWKRVTGARALVVPVPVPLRIAFDDSAAARDLGFHPRPFEEALAKL
ncbi:MAG: NAD(P)-dependent oxidoreductase [Alphaproteobacteria bacterium]|nr:NAD(P)-dependent oxidoreductase [Alphaproteobacteria bacterium]